MSVVITESLLQKIDCCFTHRLEWFAGDGVEFFARHTPGFLLRKGGVE